MVLLVAHGSGTSPLIGLAGIGLSARVDVVSVVMMLLVSFVGWVVVRYAAHLPRRRGAAGRVHRLARARTLAAVLLLVLAGNLVQFVLAWIATSLCLHKLLLFYPDRVAGAAGGAQEVRRAPGSATPR